MPGCPCVWILSGRYLLNRATFCNQVTGSVYAIKIWLFLWFAISSEPLICLQPNLVWYYIIKRQSVLWQNGIAVFKEGHSAGSKCQWMLDRTISSEASNMLSPNLAWGYIIMSRSVVLQKKKERKIYIWFAIFKVKVTERDYIINR